MWAKTLHDGLNPVCEIFLYKEVNKKSILRYNAGMKVNSVLFGTGASSLPKVSRESKVSEFAYLPSENHHHKGIISANAFKRLLVATGVIAVVVTLSRLKMPFGKTHAKLFCAVA